MTPKLISIRTKSGDDITPVEMMRDYLGLSQRQIVEAMAERVQATSIDFIEWSKGNPCGFPNDGVETARWLRDDS